MRVYGTLILIALKSNAVFFLNKNYDVLNKKRLINKNT